MSMQHVFISYHHDDLDFAENVINRVEKAGYSTWTDDKLHAGEDWRAMIDIAIKNAFALIVIMTPEAKASEYVTYEWAFAWGVGVRVIPLMLRPTPLHPRLEAMQYLDFTNPKIRPWDRLIEEIKAAANVPLAHTINIPLNSPPFIRQAVMALDSANEDDREAAVRTLQQVGSPEAQTVLIEALQHPIEDVRRASTEALVQMRATSAVPSLVQLLHDSEGSVRWAVINALGSLEDKTALPALTERLRDPDADKDEHEEVAIAIAMGKLGDTTAVPKLIEIISDPFGRIYDTSSQWEEIGHFIGILADVTVIPVLEKAVEGLSVIDKRRQRNALRDAIRIIRQRIDGGDHSRLE
jgi:TIR domain/HEAT repeats/PBS lyase HEAT-like repeat